MLRLTVYLALSSLMLVAFGQTHDDFLVCKPIGSLFEMQPSRSSGNVSGLRGPAGPPGKRGRRGFPGRAGSVGPVGRPGIVNWTEVDVRVETKIKEILSCPGIWFKKSCYWLPRIAASTSYLKGKVWSENLCHFYNGTLIDIESKEMYDVIYRYVQRTWNIYIDHPTWNVVYVWLASTYENGRVRSSTGGEVYTKWYPGYPTTGPVMGWAIGIDQSRSEVDIGMWTDSDLNYNHGPPLCKIRV